MTLVRRAIKRLAPGEFGAGVGREAGEDQA